MLGMTHDPISIEWIDTLYVFGSKVIAWFCDLFVRNHACWEDP